MSPANPQRPDFVERLVAVDLHAGGIPGRVVTRGLPDIPGVSMLEKASYVQAHLDGLRQLMLNEPRGYPASCCNFVVPSANPDADLGFIIMEHVEYPSMSGSNTLCVATAAVELGLVEVSEPVSRFTLEAPAGLIEITARVENGRAVEVTFRNVPAYVVHLDAPLSVPGHGTVTVDIAWGGMFYVIADAEQFGLSISPGAGREIARVGRMLTLAASEQYSVTHPLYPNVSGVTISQLSAPPRDPSRSDRQNAVTMSSGPADWNDPDSFTGGIDRSPCGTGTSAKMACLHARGGLALGEEFRHEGILGTVWKGRLVDEATVGGHAAVVPEISGRAWITGFAEYVRDAADPFPLGFRVGDIWGGG